MVVQKFVFRENWVGSKVVAGMKTTYFPIFDPIWTYILARKDANKEFFKQNFSFQLIRKTEVIFPHGNCLYILYRNILHTFCIHFVCKMYTEICRNIGYILYTKCIHKFVEIWDTFCIQRFCIHFYTFCIHQFWSTKSVHHKHYVYSWYTTFIQNVIQIIVCRMDPLYQNISTCLLCTS